MNYFRAKPEFIISNYIIARETAQPAKKYPLLSVFQLRISLLSVMNSVFETSRNVLNLDPRLSLVCLWPKTKEKEPRIEVGM